MKILTSVILPLFIVACSDNNSVTEEIGVPIDELVGEYETNETAGVAKVFMSVPFRLDGIKMFFGQTKEDDLCEDGVSLYDEDGVLVGFVDTNKTIIDLDGFFNGVCNQDTAMYDEKGHLIGGECIGAVNDFLLVDKNGTPVPQKIFTLPCAE